MASSLNKVQLIGNIGADPVVRFTPAGLPVATLNIATTDYWKDKDTGAPKEKTEWHRLVAFGKLAELARDYVKKGSQIYIEGKLRTRKWQDKDGQDRYTVEIVCDEIKLLGKREGGAEPADAPPVDDAPQTPDRMLDPDDHPY